MPSRTPFALLASPDRHGIFWAVLAWAAWWGFPLWMLAGHWESNPQYGYGWLVPPLTLVLAWQRWRTRPVAGPTPRGDLALILGSAALVLPCWLVGQANPGWRVAAALLTLSAIAGTMGLLARLGGWPWVRHFAFPVLFPLTAVPWPSLPEQYLVQGLMQCVAGLTVTLLNLFGMAAAQRGNLVEVATGVLGVDEACSGVRSLQAALMAALFLGEFYRLRVGRRVALVAIGFGAAMLTNVARTSFLSISAARHGIDSVAHWHDPAGYTVLTICLVLIALCAQWLSGRPPAASASPLAVTARLPSARLGVVISAWLGFVLLATELWYAHPPAGKTTNWVIDYPLGAKPEPLPERSLMLLACDRHRSASWRDRLGIDWTMYFLEWDPNRSRMLLLTRIHRPEVCLTGAGWAEAGPRSTMNVSVEGFDLSFEVLQFQDMRGVTAHVFFCPWEIVPGGKGRNVPFRGDIRSVSLRRVWQRERLLGQQTAEFIALNAPSREAAEESLREQLAGLVKTAAK